MLEGETCIGYADDLALTVECKTAEEIQARRK